MNGPKVFTPSHIRKKPSWKTIFKFISENIAAINSDTIVKEFRMVNISGNSIKTNQSEMLNNKLLKVILNIYDSYEETDIEFIISSGFDEIY
ncbi:hypothetical protein M0804_011737 [Polistes exclamans]|nr:hypothetical protein M0804_011737 [Polistes exclamans]